MLKFVSAGATDVGLRRSNNEDNYLILQEAGMLTVADGMGGAAAGEVASGIFVESAAEIFKEGHVASADHASVMVQDAFRLANERMIEHVRKYPDHQGMGCTAELLVITGERYVLGHVGDSRGYVLREGELRQITKDHSLVQQQVDKGLISKADARNHAMKNVVLRALGANIELSLDLIRGRVVPGDLFLLCSDGLTDMLEDEEIKKVVASSRRLEEKVKLLIDGAKAAGGRDNVTVVLCQL